MEGQEQRTRERRPEAFGEVDRRIHHLFPQYQTRELAMRYITGLMSPVTAGDRSPINVGINCMRSKW